MCSWKTMLKIAVAVVLVILIAFVALPQFRTIIIGLAPFALYAVCPLAMIFGMKSMASNETKKETKRN